MTAWKPVAVLIAVLATLMLVALFGVDHRTGIPNTLGWVLLAVLAVGALRLFKDDV